MQRSPIENFAKLCASCVTTISREYRYHNHSCSVLEKLLHFKWISKYIFLKDPTFLCKIGYLSIYDLYIENTKLEAILIYYLCSSYQPTNVYQQRNEVLHTLFRNEFISSITTQKILSVLHSNISTNISTLLKLISDCLKVSCIYF